MHVNYNDLTPKQKEHMCKIYLWIQVNNREFWWAEDAEYSSRTIKSLINKGLLNEYTEHSVTLTYRGEELGRSCFVRTTKFDQYAVEVGFL